MSETVVLNKKLVTQINANSPFKITESDVTSYDGDAKRLVDEFLIPYLFSSYKSNFKVSKTAGDVSLATRKMLNLNEGDFNSEKEFDSYRKYMRKLVQKIPELKVLEEVEANRKLKPKNVIFGIPATKVVGTDEFAAIFEDSPKERVEDEESSRIVNRLKGKTFNDLKNPINYGGDYSGGGTKEGQKFRAELQQLGDPRQEDPDKIFETKQITDELDNPNKFKKFKVYKYLDFIRAGNIGRFYFRTEEFYKDVFENMGMDLQKNFSKVGSTDATKYDVGDLETNLLEQLEPIYDNKTKLARAFKLDYVSNKQVEFGGNDVNGNFTRTAQEENNALKQSRDALLNATHTEDIAKKITAYAGDFFKPKGKDFRININDIIVEIDLSGVPKVEVRQEETKDDVALLSDKQFIQVGSGESMKVIAVINGINSKLDFLEKKVGRL
tara:strand:+ start:5173 stop:6492 length:1320 start_codon:yes stop_codon:yes gene_type:complete